MTYIRKRKYGNTNGNNNTLVLFLFHLLSSINFYIFKGRHKNEHSHIVSLLKNLFYKSHILLYKFIWNERKIWKRKHPTVWKKEGEKGEKNEKRDKKTVMVKEEQKKFSHFII